MPHGTNSDKSIMTWRCRWGFHKWTIWQWRKVSIVDVEKPYLIDQQYRVCVNCNTYDRKW